VNPAITSLVKPTSLLGRVMLVHFTRSAVFVSRQFVGRHCFCIVVAHNNDNICRNVVNAKNFSVLYVDRDFRH